jgi:RNA polymerase sigma factor (sigma-70 family)
VARSGPVAQGGAVAADPGDLADTVRRAQRGDLLALHELLDLLTPYLRRWCGPIALQDAADATQEALIVVMRGLRDLREPAAILGWARVIAVREAVRVARRNARAVPVELVELPAPGDPELAADVWDVLARLRPEHRAVLMLRDLEGLDERSAGELLGLPVGTVRSRLFRARTSFRAAWRGEGSTR